MITMALGMGIPPPESRDLPIVGSQPVQTFMMQLMMVIVVFCVPIMLCTKPIVIAMRHKDDVVVDQPDFEVDADDDFKHAEGLLDGGN